MMKTFEGGTVMKEADVVSSEASEGIGSMRGALLLKVVVVVSLCFCKSAAFVCYSGGKDQGK